MSVGETYGKYFLLKKLASGGMGEVFLARQQGPAGFEKVVVIKRILDHLTENSEYLELFLQEARLQARMNHSSIVQIFDLGQAEDESFYLAMEFVHGKSLVELLTRLRNTKQRLPPQLVALIIERAAEGLSYAHNLADNAGRSLNIIHRDISPHNVLISYQGDVKLIDFGIAKSEMSVVKTETGTIKGKFYYMSPEQSAARKLDKRSDLFSLGIVLYECLCGENPFYRSNVVLSLEAIQKTDPPAPSTIDPLLAVFDPILAKVLAKDPEVRYEDGSDLKDDLVRARASLPAPAERLGPYLSRIFKDKLAQEAKVLLDTDSASLSSLEAISHGPGTGSGKKALPHSPTPKPSTPLERLPGARLTTEPELAAAGSAEGAAQEEVGVEKTRIKVSTENRVTVRPGNGVAAAPATAEDSAATAPVMPAIKINRGGMAAPNLGEADTLVPRDPDTLVPGKGEPDSGVPRAPDQDKEVGRPTVLMPALKEQALGDPDASEEATDSAAPSAAELQAIKKPKAGLFLGIAAVVVLGGAGTLFALNRGGEAKGIDAVPPPIETPVKSAADEEVRKAEEARKAEDAKKSEEAAKQAEQLKAEEAKKAAEAEKTEQARKAEEQRQADEAKQAEQARKADERKQAGEARQAEQARKAEEKRQAGEARQAELARKAEEKRQAEEAKKLEAKKKADEKKLAAANPPPPPPPPPVDARKGGTLLIKSTPMAQVLHNGKAISGVKIDLLAGGGTIDVVGEGSAFKIHLSYGADGSLELASEPWAIAYVNNLSKGKTPTRLAFEDEPMRVEFKRPGQEQTVQLILRYNRN